MWKCQWGKGLDSPIQDGFPAAVQVIKLLLGDGVIHVHGWDTELPSLGELVEPGREQRQVRADSSDSLRSLGLPSQSSHLCTPVTLSSTIPRIFLNTLGYFLYTQWVRSPPSSRIYRTGKAEQGTVRPPTGKCTG